MFLKKSLVSVWFEAHLAAVSLNTRYQIPNTYKKKKQKKQTDEKKIG